MSIYRPDFQNTSVIIKRFGAITEDYSAVEWIGINGTYLRGISGTSHISFTPESTILIKCEIGAGATGPITGGLGGLRISVGSGTISWYNVTNGWVVDRTVGSGTHILGWMRYNGATYPYYDGIITDVSGETTPPRRRVYFGCFSQNNTAGGADSSDILSSSSATYAIKIYEVAGALAYNNEVVTPAHMYAALWGSTYRLFEARMGHDSDTVLTPHSSSASGGGSAVTYGVQLHDLKYAFSSPYKDLMAIVCQDDSSKAESSADPAEQITNGSATHTMAFIMKDSGGSIPLPSGFSVSTRASSHYNNYEKGDLVYRRFPKWNIWADDRKLGLWIRMESNRYYMGYNVFKDYNGDKPHGDKLELLDWDGHNTSASAAHAPQLVAASSINVEFHNRFPVKCTSEQLFAGTPNGSDYTIGTVKDENLVFFYDENNVDGGAAFRAGNLIPWNYDSSQGELYQRNKIYGVMCTAQFADESNIFKAVIREANGAVLDKNSSASVKQKYRETVLYKPFNYGGGYTSHLIDVLINGTAAQKRIYCGLALLRAATDNPDNTQIVDVSRFIDETVTSLQGTFNPAIVSGATNYRIVVADHTATATSRLGIMIGGGGNYVPFNNAVVSRCYSTTASKYKYVVIPLATIDSNNEPIFPSQSATFHQYIASVVMYYHKGGNSYGCVSGVFKSMSYAAAESAYADSNTDRPIYYWDRGSTNPVSDFQHFYYQRGTDKKDLYNYPSNLTGSGGDKMTEVGSFIVVDCESDVIGWMDDDVAMSGIYESTTVVVDVYKLSLAITDSNPLNAPIFYRVQGEWHNGTRSLIQNFQTLTYVVQVPNPMNKADYDSRTYGAYNYIYNELCLFYTNNSGSYTALNASIPNMDVALMLYRGGATTPTFVCSFTVASGGTGSGGVAANETSAYRLYLTYSEATEYSGYMNCLDGTTRQLGFATAVVVETSNNRAQPGDFYVLDYAYFD